MDERFLERRIDVKASLEWSNRPADFSFCPNGALPGYLRQQEFQRRIELIAVDCRKIRPCNTLSRGRQYGK
jgi:hypothetical protein